MVKLPCLFLCNHLIINLGNAQQQPKSNLLTPTQVAASEFLISLAADFFFSMHNFFNA